MTAVEFLISLIVLLIVFLYRVKIATYINDNLDAKYQIKSDWITYFLIFLFVIITVIGMLTEQTTPFGAMTVGGGVENIQPTNSDKPHRLFDIDFDVFNF